MKIALNIEILFSQSCIIFTCRNLLKSYNLTQVKRETCFKYQTKFFFYSLNEGIIIYNFVEICRKFEL